MGFAAMRKYGTTHQYLISLAFITITAVTCYFSVDYTGYRVVALVLLLVVSVLAMLFEIFPVLFTAVLSALTWNYFFIPPTFNFYIGTTEDALMFLMYFVIALINAVLTFKIRQYEKKARDQEEREKTIQLYNTLLNSLSHELRTPISTIIGSVDAIKESNGRLSEASKKELISEIEIAGIRLNRQVENLLNISRLEAGVLHPKEDWCDVNELVHKVIERNKTDAQNHTILFKHNQSLPLLKTDQGLLEQVLHNLLHNALLYTPQKSTIWIEADPVDQGYRFIVSDNGRGFTDKEIGSVFDKFYRLPHSEAGGIGLGLSLVKGFTEALGGTIKLTSPKSGGTEFTIKIPAQVSTLDELNDE